MYQVYNKSLHQVWGLKRSTIDTILLPSLPIYVSHHLDGATKSTRINQNYIKYKQQKSIKTLEFSSFLAFQLFLAFSLNKNPFGGSLSFVNMLIHRLFFPQTGCNLLASRSWRNNKKFAILEIFLPKFIRVHIKSPENEGNFILKEILRNFDLEEEILDNCKQANKITMKHPNIQKYKIVFQWSDLLLQRGWGWIKALKHCNLCCWLPCYFVGNKLLMKLQIVTYLCNPSLLSLLWFK